MREKHILLISSWYPNRHNPTHGIFNRYFAEAVALYNRVSVLHVCSEARDDEGFRVERTREARISTVTVYYKKVESRWPLLGLLRKRKRVIAAMEHGYRILFPAPARPDLIQLNVIMPLGLGMLHLSRKYRLPYVLNENWSGYTKEDGSYRGFALKALTRRIVAGARAILPTSVYLRDAMLSRGLKGNYHVVPNVVNVQRFKPAENTARAKAITFLHVSSLNDREKNVSGLLRAFRAALSANPSLQLNIVGTGVDEALYRRVVNETGLSANVTFKGRLLSRELVSEFSRSDALLMFSNYETFSLVNIEAFACGKPVITSDAGAIPSYMNPRLGIMVEKGNEAQLTDAILSFADDPQAYSGDEIRQFAIDHFSYEKVGGDLDRIYDSVLNKDRA